MKTEEVIAVVKCAFDYLTTEEVLNFIMNVESCQNSNKIPVNKEEVFIDNLYKKGLVRDNSFYHRLDKHSSLFLSRTLNEVYNESWSEIKDLILEKNITEYQEPFKSFIEYKEENGNERIEDLLPKLMTEKEYFIAPIILQLGIGRMNIIGTEYLEERDEFLHIYRNTFYIKMYNNIIYRIELAMETYEYDETLELDHFEINMKMIHNELEILTKEIRKTNMIKMLDFLNGKNVFTMEIETNGNVFMGLTNESIEFNIKNRNIFIQTIEEIFEFKTIINNGVMVYYRPTPIDTKNYKQNL